MLEFIQVPIYRRRQAPKESYLSSRTSSMQLSFQNARRLQHCLSKQTLCRRYCRPLLPQADIRLGRMADRKFPGIYQLGHLRGTDQRTDAQTRRSRLATLSSLVRQGAAVSADSRARPPKLFQSRRAKSPTSDINLCRPSVCAATTRHAISCGSSARRNSERAIRIR